MSIQITSDSTCDLSPALLQSYGVRIIPLSVIQGGTSYKDGVDIQPADIFAHVEQGGDLPTTSAVSVGEYRALFAELSPQHEAVVHITISADFSSCYQNACIAAEEFGNVYVVDSRNLSTGHGLVVVEAALAARRGMAPDELVPFLRELTGRVEASFLIDRLDYMVKGGRCSAVAMLGANLLRLKPCIEVNPADGSMNVGKKYRGSLDKALSQYVRDKLEGCADLKTDRVFITHSGISQERIDMVRDLVKQYADFKEIYVTRAGCTISSHCGPNTLGVLFMTNS